MTDKLEITPEILRECVLFDGDTGVMIWRKRPPRFFKAGCLPQEVSCAAWNARYAGKAVLPRVDRHGYSVISFFNRPIFLHRAAWAIYYGEWPNGEIDHINGRRSDNRIGNLRVASRQENMRNRRIRHDHPLGFGVYPTKTGRWRAQIGVCGKAKYLGEWPTFEQAVSARHIAENKYGFI